MAYDGWPVVGDFTLLPNFVPDRNFVENLQSWDGTDWFPENHDALPFVALNATGEYLNLFDSIQWPAGAINVHPYPEKAVSVGWRSPIKGKVRVVGSAKLIQVPNCGNGVDWMLMKNHEVLRSGALPDPDASGDWSLGHVKVRKGDTVRVVVGSRGDVVCDSTQLSLEITKVGGSH
jgi:hypothetical protein